MFYNKKSTDAEALGRLVEYVRKNVQHLETLSADDLLYGDANFSWLPFQGRAERNRCRNDRHSDMMYSLDLSIGNLISGTVKIIVSLNSEPTVTVIMFTVWCTIVVFFI